jgi:hypothetical protein
MRTTIAPGPDRTHEPRQPRRRNFFTKGSYFALGWLASAGLLAWTGHLDIAIYWYAVGGVLFVLFCGPMVSLILHKLNDTMQKHHEQLPAVHGAWLKGFCPTCEAIHS